MSSSTLAGLGAFLSGAGSVLGAIFVIRSMRRRLQKECQERFELFKQGLDRGEKRVREEREHDGIHS